jgi:probable addiction module antidote protein
MPVEFEPFDISEHLDNVDVIAGYLNAAAGDDDPNVLLVALADAAKARGMKQVAKDAGLSRVSLYRALKVGAHPRFETVQAVLRALGVKLAVAARGDVSFSAALGGAGPVISKSPPISAAPRISETLSAGLSETVIVSAGLSAPWEKPGPDPGERQRGAILAAERRGRADA